MQNKILCNDVAVSNKIPIAWIVDAFKKLKVENEPFNTVNPINGKPATRYYIDQSDVNRVVEYATNALNAFKAKKANAVPVMKPQQSIAQPQTTQSVFAAPVNTIVEKPIQQSSQQASVDETKSESSFTIEGKSFTFNNCEVHLHFHQDGTQDVIIPETKKLTPESRKIKDTVKPQAVITQAPPAPPVVPIVQSDPKPLKEDIKIEPQPAPVSQPTNDVIHQVFESVKAKWLEYANDMLNVQKRINKQTYDLSYDNFMKTLVEPLNERLSKGLFSSDDDKKYCSLLRNFCVSRLSQFDMNDVLTKLPL